MSKAQGQDIRHTMWFRIFWLGDDTREDSVLEETWWHTAISITINGALFPGAILWLWCDYPPFSSPEYERSYTGKRVSRAPKRPTLQDYASNYMQPPLVLNSYLSVGTNKVCFTWPSKVDHAFVIVGQRGNIRATREIMTHIREVSLEKPLNNTQV